MKCGVQVRTCSDHGELTEIPDLRWLTRESRYGQGDVLWNRFQVKRLLGKGGAGEVYEAFDPRLDDHVAVKVLRPELSALPGPRKRIKEEVKAARRLKHVNIVSVFEYFGEEGEEPVGFTMEFVDGATLQQHLGGQIRYSPLVGEDPDEKLEAAHQVLDGLAATLDYMHGIGLIHRDVKPSNVMVLHEKPDDPMHVRLMDFSIIRQSEQRKHELLEPGTILYMPPEIVANEDAATPASDVFSFGILAYRTLTGRMPALMPEPPSTYLAGVTKEADDLILDCFRDAERRPARASLVAEAIGKGVGRRVEVIELGVFENGVALPTLVRVPAGSFSMGSPVSEAGRQSDEQSHSVEMDQRFEIAASPVTQDLFKTVMGTTPASHQGDQRAVDRVSWWEAIEFCNRLSEALKLTPVYRRSKEVLTTETQGLMGKKKSSSRVDVCYWDRGANGFRLPTEAEWEYAARADQDFVWAGSNEPEDIAWFNNAARGPQRVREKQPNTWHLHDLSGNVAEWVWDWYAPFDPSPAKNPRGPRSGSSRVTKGGNMARSAGHARIAARSKLAPGSSSALVGFRVARSIVK